MRLLYTTHAAQSKQTLTRVPITLQCLCCFKTFKGTRHDNGKIASSGLRLHLQNSSEQGRSKANQCFEHYQKNNLVGTQPKVMNKTGIDLSTSVVKGIKKERTLPVETTIDVFFSRVLKHPSQFGLKNTHFKFQNHKGITAMIQTQTTRDLTRSFNGIQVSFDSNHNLILHDPAGIVQDKSKEGLTRDDSSESNYSTGGLFDQLDSDSDTSSRYSPPENLDGSLLDDDNLDPGYEDIISDSELADVANDDGTNLDVKPPAVTQLDEELGQEYNVEVLPNLMELLQKKQNETPSSYFNSCPRLRCELKLYDICHRHKLSLTAIEEIKEWAKESVLMKPDIFNYPFRGRNEVIELSKKELGINIEEEFQSYTIPWLPDKSHQQPIYIRSFWTCLFDLLTNQAVLGQDGCNLSLPHDTDPLKSSPDHAPQYMSELHHGTWWKKSMDKLCDPNKNEMLVPLIFYLDSTLHDKNGRLPVFPFMMTLGIFKTEVRRRIREAWTMICYLPDNKAEAEYQNEETKAVHKVQNLHNCIKLALKELEMLKTTGQSVQWTLNYGGKEHNVRLKFAIAFVIGDTELHDTLCGRIQRRDKNTIHTCRMCNIATDKLVDPEAFEDVHYFTPEMFDPDVDGHDDAYFKSQSHYKIHNAFHSLEFGANEGNIYTATPPEPLHAHEKGAELRCVEALQYLIENGHKMAKDKIVGAYKKRNVKKTLTQLNLLGHLFGHRLARQSNRNKPRTTFKNPLFRQTKKTAKEQAGVCLNLMMAMLSDRGQEVMLVERTVSPAFLENQISVFELILQYGEWLKLEKAPMDQVFDGALDRQMAYYIQMVGQICNREGMGTNLIKNHLMLHIPKMMRMFGPVNGFDSGPLESFHKWESKVPAKLTQNIQAYFSSSCQCTGLNCVLSTGLHHTLRFQTLQHKSFPWRAVNTRNQRKCGNHTAVPGSR